MSDAELQLGTFIAETSLRAELRISGVGKIAAAVQGKPSWEWVVVREWEHPEQPTVEDLNNIRRAFGITETP